MVERKIRPAPLTLVARKPVKPAAKPGPTPRLGLAQKLFVLDTNVLMHDPTSLFRFEEHDIYLPMLTLEELDNNKKGVTEVARNARQASRFLDELVSAMAENIGEGIPLDAKSGGAATGRLYLQTDGITTVLPSSLANGKADFVIGTEFTRQSAWGVSGNSMGFYFSTPIKLFNRNQGEIARAQREGTQAGARIHALEASIGAEVEKAYRQYTVSSELLTSVQNDMLARARSVRDTTEYSYRRGEASLIEFLDAQRAFNDAMQTYNEVRGNFARSLYLIDTVSGATVSGS